jgi:hypothetical protein
MLIWKVQKCRNGSLGTSEKEIIKKKKRPNGAVSYILDEILLQIDVAMLCFSSSVSSHDGNLDWLEWCPRYGVSLSNQDHHYIGHKMSWAQRPSSTTINIEQVTTAWPQAARYTLLIGFLQGRTRGADCRVMISLPFWPHGIRME